MSTIYISNALNNAHTLQAVVELVNEGTCEGLNVAGGIEFTPAMLAGQYAASAALEAADGQGIEEATIEAHLDILRDEGCEFDYSSAVKHGMAIIQAEYQ